VVSDLGMKLVADYIGNNQGCTAQDIVDGLNLSISRGPIFDILKELVASEIVKDQRINRKEHRYFLEFNNPLVSIPQELDKFEKAFIILLENTNKKYYALLKEVEELRSSNTVPNIDELIKKIEGLTLSLFYLRPLQIFYSFINAYLIRSTLIWPNKFRDRKALSNLYSIIFTRIAVVQNHLFEFNKIHGSSPHTYELRSNQWIIENFLSGSLGQHRGGLIEIIEYLSTYSYSFKLAKKRKTGHEITAVKKLDMENEITDVIDALWNINKEIQVERYPEPRFYGWDFKYGKDDWRKLVQLQITHPQETLHNYVKSSGKNSRSDKGVFIEPV
jgi:hypothetical protein